MAKDKNLTCDKTSTLYLKTQELLAADERTLINLHKESGIPFYWLQRFNTETFKNPSVNRIQALYEFLSNKKLKV